jgi:hypothetical protein
MGEGLQQHAKTITDGVVGAGAITSPIWLQFAEHGAQTMTIFGGLAIVLGRGYLMYLEWRDRRATGGKS